MDGWLPNILPPNSSKSYPTMPWDAVNIRNHDLYKNSTVQGMLDTTHHGGIVPAFGEKYLRPWGGGGVAERQFVKGLVVDHDLMPFWKRLAWWSPCS